MSGNIAHLSYFKDFDGGYVTFGGGANGGRITGKGTIKTDKLDFEDVYFVKELKFNLFSVSQMCDKKNYVLFTDSECLFTKDGLTCLVAKATSEEIMEKVLKREYSVARITQENGVAERKNMTLIEAARTMLADSKLPTTFWAEAVSTACYVQNRVLIVKPHNKTPYELFRGHRLYEVFAPVARIEAIEYYWLMLLIWVSQSTKWMSKVLSYMVKLREVYVCHPPDFEILDNPDKVYKEDRLINFIHQIREKRGRSCLSVLCRCSIYWMTKEELCDEFEKLMKDKFRLSFMGDLTFFWDLQDSPLELVAYTYSDYAGATMIGSQPLEVVSFLGNRLISWQCKKQTVDCTLQLEAEYVAAASCCGQHACPKQRLCIGLSQSKRPISKDSSNPFMAGSCKNYTLCGIRYHQIIDFLNRSHICYALTKKPEVCVSFIKQFWRSAEASTDDNGEVKINATIDGHSLSITEGSLRRHLKLADQDGITSIPNSEIFEQLALMGYHTDSDKLTFQKGAFSPQWRFIQICLDMQRHQLQQHTRIYPVPSLSMKVFNNMKRPTKGFSGQEVALFSTMLDVTEPSTLPSKITSSPSPTPSPSPEPTPAHTTADVTIPSPTQPSPTQPSPTQPGTEHHVPTPHDSPLHAVHSHGSDEGSLKLNELMNLVTQLSDRIGVLEADLMKTKKTYSSAYTKLILKVKKLESQIKIGKARRQARVVLSDDELCEDDSSKQGRKLADVEVQEKASTDTELFIQEVTPTEVIQDQEGSEKASDELVTCWCIESTASEKSNSCTAEVNLVLLEELLPIQEGVQRKDQDKIREKP
ncbi:ribonuclease H-like domain-containing protein [Tanacetum coccineum]